MLNQLAGIGLSLARPIPGVSSSASFFGLVVCHVGDNQQIRAAYGVECGQSTHRSVGGCVQSYQALTEPLDPSRVNHNIGRTPPRMTPNSMLSSSVNLGNLRGGPRLYFVPRHAPGCMPNPPVTHGTTESGTDASRVSHNGYPSLILGSTGERRRAESKFVDSQYPGFICCILYQSSASW